MSLLRSKKSKRLYLVCLIFGINALWQADIDSSHSQWPSGVHDSKFTRLYNYHKKEKYEIYDLAPDFKIIRVEIGKLVSGRSEYKVDEHTGPLNFQRTNRPVDFERLRHENIVPLASRAVVLRPLLGNHSKLA